MSRLNAYLALEREMLRLDEAGASLADALRDSMDPIWHQLSQAERQFLNERTIPARLAELEPIHGALTPVAPVLPRITFIDATALHSASWRHAA